MKKVLRLFTCLCLSLSVLCNVSVFADETSEIIHNSWGADVMKIDGYIQYASDYNDNETIVAVIDSGVDYTHSYLKDSILYDDEGNLVGYDFVDDDNDPQDELLRSYHGTHVAGTIVDLTQTLNVKIMPLRAGDDSGYFDAEDVANAIFYAVNHGADVINCSFYVDYGDFSMVDEAVAYAISNNVTIVAAAGNDDASLDDELTDRCPQHISDVICVAAIEGYEEVIGYYTAAYSNYGSNVDFAAPGSDILSCKGGLTNDYQYLSGTSMATPHITACVAMLYLTNPNITPAEVEEQLKNCCLDVEGSGKDIFTGYGIPQMEYLAYPDTHHEIGNMTYIGYEATCCETGLVTYHNCKYCNKLLDDNGNVISIDDIIIPCDPNNHESDIAGIYDTYGFKEESCTVDGYTGDLYCYGCGKLLKNGTIIPATGIHTWDQGVVTKAATKTSEGLMTYTCQNCKQVKTEVIAKLGDTTNTQTTTKVPNTGIYTSVAPLFLAMLSGLMVLEIKRRR